MAIWQYTFFVIPRDNYMNLNYDRNEDVDDFLSWRVHKINDLSIELLSNVLKPSKSWSESIKQFGLIK